MLKSDKATKASHTLNLEYCRWFCGLYSLSSDCSQSSDSLRVVDNGISGSKAGAELLPVKHLLMQASTPVNKDLVRFKVK